MDWLLPFCLTLIGAAGVYLASPNQLWLDRPLPLAAGLTAGAMLAGATGLWIAAWAMPIGLFMALVLLMACLTAFPLLGAFSRRRRKGTGR